MKKAIALLLILTLCGAAMAGCGGGQDNPTGKREISPSGAPAEKNQEPSPDASSEEEKNPSPTPALEEGTIASLEEIKQNAIKAGYEIAEMEDGLGQMGQGNMENAPDEGEEFAELGEMLAQAREEQMKGFVGGFEIIIGDTHIPVMEFETPNDAQRIADMTNEAGYNVAIVNGRFFTCVGATKGVIENEQEQAALEKIMDAKAQVQEQWSDTEDVPVNTTDYMSGYALMDNIRKSMATLLDQTLTKHNKAHPEGDPESTEDVVPFIFGSFSMPLTSSFSEDEVYEEGIASTADFIGITEVKLTRNAPHDYTLTGKQPGDDSPFEIHGIYDPATGSLRMVAKSDGKVTESFEFIPLGGDQYAFQADEERAVVTYKSGKLESFIYTRTNNYFTRIGDGGFKYHSESDSIYPAGTGVNEKWAAVKGEDDYAEYYAFDGTTIKLSAKPFDERVKVEIPVNISGN